MTRTVIRNANNIVIERFGNAIHVYTLGAITQNIAIGFAVPSVYCPKTSIAKSCVYKTSGSGYQATLASLETDGTVIFRNSSGSNTTDYIYCAFGFMYFI